MSKLTLKEFLVADAILGNTPKVIDQSINIDKEFNKFFEFDTGDKSVVTSVSCKLFAKYIADLCSIKTTV
jgi:hypothetical protein